MGVEQPPPSGSSFPLKLEASLEERFLNRIMSMDVPVLVVPEKLEHLILWLLAEKLIRTCPSVRDIELASILNCEDMHLLSEMIMEQTEREGRWLQGGENGYESFALAGYASALSGARSSPGTTAYNDLRRRMGLPAYEPPPDLSPSDHDLHDGP